MNQKDVYSVDFTFGELEALEGLFENHRRQVGADKALLETADKLTEWRGEPIVSDVYSVDLTRGELERLESLIDTHRRQVGGLDEALQEAADHIAYRLGNLAGTPKQGPVRDLFLELMDAARFASEGGINREDFLNLSRACYDAYRTWTDVAKGRA